MAPNLCSQSRLGVQGAPQILLMEKKLRSLSALSEMAPLRVRPGSRKSLLLRLRVRRKTMVHW